MKEVKDYCEKGQRGDFCERGLEKVTSLVGNSVSLRRHCSPFSLLSLHCNLPFALCTMHCTLVHNVHFDANKVGERKAMWTKAERSNCVHLLPCSRYPLTQMSTFSILFLRSSFSNIACPIFLASQIWLLNLPLVACSRSSFPHL